MALPIGPQYVTVNQQSSYFVHPADTPGTIILWTITGGVILTGQSTSQIVVQWTTEGEGRVEVSITHPGREPEIDGITVIVDADEATN